MSAKSRVLKKDILNRNLPVNPKYKNVRPRVDSGASVRRYMELMQESHRNIKFRKDEVFKRIKLSTFVTLIIELSREKLSNQYQEECNLPPIRPNTTNNVLATKPYTVSEQLFDEVKTRNETDPKRKSSAGNNSNISNFRDQSPRRSKSVMSYYSVSKSTFQNVIAGIGEMDIKYDDSRPASVVPSEKIFEDPYLLLDVRDSDDYKQCHIITAKNYHYSMLIRTCNYETNDMLTYKNSPNKIIVIYDEDEVLASRVASTLVQRGYDNVFMLSGGLKLTSYRFPKGLITGVLPLSCQQGMSSKRSMSLNRLNSCNISEIAFKTVLKDTFTAEDVQLLQLYLDKWLETLGISSHYGSERSKTAQSSTRKLQNRSTLAISTSKIMPWK